MEAKITDDNLLYFFYKDSGLINSFYAQLFGGNTEIISRSMSTSETNKQALQAGLHFVSGVTEGETIEGIENGQTISPHDFKILQLLDELNLKQFEFIKLRQTQLIKASGVAKFLNIDDIIPLALPFIDNKSFGGFTADQIKEFFSNYKTGTSILLDSSGTHFSIPLISEYLTLNPQDISRLYGAALPGEYTVIGIYHKNNTYENKTPIHALLGMPHILFDKLLDINTNTNHVIVPLLIYQNIKMGQ